jgi:Tfp pilus assembly protein PilN
VKKKNVVVELRPGRLDFMIEDGSGMAKVTRLDVSDEEDPLEWVKTIRRSAVSLRSVVNEANAVGAPTRVIYRSPTQSVAMSSFGVGSTGQAIEAATLSCCDALPYSAMTAICQATVVGRDGSGDKRQTHVVAAAEREDVAESIVQLIEEADLHFASATPLDAAVMSNFVACELASKAERRAALYVGEYTSFFVVVSRGALLFSRRIDLGLESLASALTRPITAIGRPEPVELSIDEARTLLQKHGIPDRDATVHEAHGLTGAQVIPLLQPALQRFIIELRQSLRFGVSEEDRSGLTIEVTGSGSTIRGLAPLIESELGTQATENASYATSAGWHEAGAKGGELVDALRGRRVLLDLNLMPQEMAQQRRTSRLRRWLWTGAAAAVAVVASDGMRYHVQLDGAREEAEIYRTQLVDLEGLRATGEQLKAVVAASVGLDRSIEEEIGTTVNYRACMHELSRLTPRSIRLTSVGFQRNQGRTEGTLAGVAFETEDGSDRTELEEFIQTLRESPLFRAVVLGNVQIGTIGDTDGQRFNVTLEAIAVPRVARGERTVSAGDTAAEGTLP